ncbi:MAG: family 43 glycosylhydrolase [Pseudomonadota bacterium]
MRSMCVVAMALESLWPAYASAETSLSLHYMKMSPPMPGEMWHIHDPSRIVTLDDGSQIVAATGKAQEDGYRCGLEMWKRLSARSEWQPHDCIFIDKPDWVAEELPENDGAYWAPDLLDDSTLFYSVSDDGDDARNGTCVGAARKVGGEWRDIGQPISCIFGDVDGREVSSIDPSVFQTSNGQLLLVTGGAAIHMTEINAETLMPISGDWFSPDDPSWAVVARGPVLDGEHEWVEAAHLHKHGEHYYLFVNWGSCCSGVDSTYEIRVGRSQTINGPYLDRAGGEMTDGGGALFMGAMAQQIGPGHASVNPATPGNPQTISYHFYDAERDGLPWIGERQISWVDGWPVVGNLVAN